jgi:heme exporter protein A
LIYAENLGIRFGPRWLFRGLEFEVNKGQKLAILGKNGSGKSTLLRVLCGLQRATEGKVRLPDGELRHNVGYAALDMALYPELSVREHLEFTASMRGCPARIPELLEQVGLAYAREVLGEHLSSGMKARLKLALAIQAQPKVLMLDEPSASLDEEGRQLLMDACEMQSRTGCVIIATNDPLERQMTTHELNLDI